MKLLEQLAIKYGTDKRIDGGHGYTEYYSEYFDSRRLNKLNILELGIREGASIKVWHDYFENSIICGIDNNLEGLCPESFGEDRIKFEIGSQDNPEFLNDICDKYGPFDIIVDDCSHVSPLTIKSFEILFPKLNSCGIYVIEDLHVCDYDQHYLPYGPSVFQFLANINKANYNIVDMQLFDKKIVFIRKKCD